LYPNPTFLERLDYWFAYVAGTQLDVFLHGALATLLCMFIALALGRKKPLYISWVFAFSIGIAEEIRQVIFNNPFTFDDIVDMVINGGFAGFGVVIIYFVRKVRSKVDRESGLDIKKLIVLSVIGILWLTMTVAAYRYSEVRYSVYIHTDPPALIRVEGKEPKKHKLWLRGYPNQLLTILTAWKDGTTTTSVVQVKSDTTFVIYGK